MVWGLGNGSGSGKGKGPVDKRSANPSPISNNKVQKAQDPIGAWIFGLAAKNRLSVLPWESDRKGSGRIATFGTWSLSAGLAYSVVNAGTTTTLPLTREQKNSAKDSSTRDVAEETIRPECLATICHARTVALNLGQKSIMKGWLICLRKRSAGHHLDISLAPGHTLVSTTSSSKPVPPLSASACIVTPGATSNAPGNISTETIMGLDLHMVSATGTSSGRHSKLGGDEMSEMPPQFIELRDTLREVDVSARPQYSLYSNLVADLLYMIQF
ncbi:hypothetical protein SNOG_09505 [Parastagonospora nodorum SN15]|uniref:Uncharacterized protein n=1 Tax=Phaeosphaeria nodorum (strain SN15 / ATCC MYA-4574 / FGSC 10173) TaxID=321614 RepID=Q0UFF9_PHANO|nr:hypothetical protein SNOG_09505 [Parastagonospora nodorum SN15]EAT82770.1 hypothetical protein SNOG_09505 [Parastagonospora nodorum SN15]